MCVEKLGKVKKEPVKGWKLFYFPLDREKRLRLMCLYNARKYTVGQTYESERGPGFQAFVKRTDACASRSVWMRPQEMCVRAVMLYNARKGTIEGMDPRADGKLGWFAPRMRILPKSNA